MGFEPRLLPYRQRTFRYTNDTHRCLFENPLLSSSEDCYFLACDNQFTLNFSAIYDRLSVLPILSVLRLRY